MGGGSLYQYLLTSVQSNIAVYDLVATFQFQLGRTGSPWTLMCSFEADVNNLLLRPKFTLMQTKELRLAKARI